MRPFILRSEEPPDDVVVVVRGGEMNSDYVREAARDSFLESGLYGISVFLAIDATVEELCVMEPYIARYGKVRLTTVGRLREAGFALPTLDRPHYDVVLPDTSDTTLDRREASFDRPIPNPGRTRRP